MTMNNYQVDYMLHIYKVRNDKAFDKAHGHVHFNHLYLTSKDLQNISVTMQCLNNCPIIKSINLK